MLIRHTSFMESYHLLLAFILLYVPLYHTETGQIAADIPRSSIGHRVDTIDYRSPGERCTPNDFRWYPVQEDPRKFLYCGRKTKYCYHPFRSSEFGQPCFQNTDCLDNMYCPSGTCQCVAGFIDQGKTCVPAVAPDEPGCSDDRQCHAYWPTTKCTNGVCKCVLPDGLRDDNYIARSQNTSEGIVCIIENNRTTVVFCPLPIPTTDTDTDPAARGGPAVFGQLLCTNDNTGCKVTENSVDETTKWSDMVLCVPTTKLAPDPTALCCPNRAHTCMQPKPDPTTSPTGEQRYWYNQATGSCEMFLWDGKVPWANNFKTQDHCLSYCGGICQRGYTKVTNGKVQTCDSTRACDNTQECIEVASAGHQLCCQTRNTVCAAPTAGKNINGVPKTGVANKTRWRYSAQGQQRMCESFSYTGWGGDYNNFASQQECEAFCISAACDQGQPLKDGNGMNQRCESSSRCPTSYECKSAICCPKKQTVCIQPQRQGSCTQSVSRYWYNAATRDCEQFTFTGCGGNDNNFESYQRCVSYCREVKPEPLCMQGMADKDSAGKYYTCSASGAARTCKQNYECYFDGFSFGCCPQRAYTCSLTKSIGAMCVTPTSRWYYDTTTRSCQTFTYNGCDGNSNNFINRQECERYCGVGGCPFGGEPLREDSGATRVCSAPVPCPNGFTCSTVGVAGSSVNYCCKTRATICQQPPLQGTACGQQVQRYYYNIATRQCTTFTYFGCGGNENSFSTLSQCNNFCGSAACLAGEAAYMDPNTNRPLPCNSMLANSCPKGYACRTNPLNNTNTCCGSSDMGVCPTSQHAYMDALTGDVRECQPSIGSSCADNYLCLPNSRTGRYYCCATAAGGMCPPGKAVYRSLDTNQPEPCFVSTMNVCPHDYSCQPTTTGQSQGYCCTIAALCPNGGEFFVETKTQQPRKCIVQVGFNQCPNPYTCQPNNPAAPTAGYCCRSGPAGICATGAPLLQDGVLRQCAPNQPSACPDGYTCTLASTGGNVHYCCPKTSAQGLCPSGQPLLEGGILRQCVPGQPLACPVGYGCSLASAGGNVHYCCSTTGAQDGCPPGMVAYRDPLTSVIRACTLGGPQCPAPYSCQTAASGALQCCGLTGGCPSPNVAAINPSTGQPLVCSSAAACPTGFQCLPASNGRMTCCGTGTALAIVTTRCPFPDQRPYIIPETGQPQACRVGIPICPPGYECVNGGGGYICCSRHSQGKTQCWGTCTPGVKNNCIKGYTCERVGAKYSCCSGTAMATGCPSGKPFMYPGTQSPLQCHFRSSTGTGSDTCPIGYRCTKTMAGRNYCCPTRG